MKVSIVIPAYNEEKRISNTLESYISYFERLRKKNKLNYEILVAINKTSDRTMEIVKSFKKKNERVQYINLPKAGKGYAITEGFKILLKKNVDYIGFVDADMATSPEAFYDLVQNIEGYDGIMGSRYLSGAVVNPKQSLKRIVVSRIFNFAIRSLLFLPYKDTQCGAKIFKKDAIKSVLPNLTMSQWAFDIDILYNLRKLGYKVREYPTVWADKEYSKINFMKAGPKMVLAVIRLRILNSPLRDLMRAYVVFRKKK